MYEWFYRNGVCKILCDCELVLNVFLRYGYIIICIWIMSVKWKIFNDYYWILVFENDCYLSDV